MDDEACTLNFNRKRGGKKEERKREKETRILGNGIRPKFLSYLTKKYTNILRMTISKGSFLIHDQNKDKYFFCIFA